MTHALSIRAASFEAVCSFDPEIDTKKVPIEAMQTYVTTRSEAALAAIRPAFSRTGPTIYRVREIPRSAFSWVDEGATPEEKWRRAFMVGVESVTGIYQSSGSQLQAAWQGSESTPVLGGQTIRTMTPEDLQTYFTPAEWQEIGSVAYTHSFLPRRIASCFRLPPSLLRRLADQDFRPLVDASPISQESSNA